MVTNITPKVVTVHRGARDGYQVARALHEANMLEALVTDMYWPTDQAWAQVVERVLPVNAIKRLRLRSMAGLPSRSVTQCSMSGLWSIALGRPKMPFAWRRDSTRWCDRELGRAAGELASRTGSALLSYSYYAHSAFSHYTGHAPRILFQLHPHPGRVREILNRERELHPECATSLDREWEIALPESDFQQLVGEATMPDYWLVASQFSKLTLVQSGVPADKITVIPYGTDLDSTKPRERSIPASGPLKLLFVGTICQRKGLAYLLEAMQKLRPEEATLTICGRAVDDMKWIRNSGVPVRIRANISAAALLEEYAASDVFVFPSLAEGFGHVLLEAMASGLPIVSTNRTAAPDLTTEGVEGFIAEAGDPASLVAAIRHFVSDPSKVRTMGKASRARAEQFTWARFRNCISESVAQSITNSAPEKEAACSAR